MKELFLKQLKEDPSLWKDLKLLKSALKHGDMAVPSDRAHSGRHVISQWQRQAAGAIITTLARDKDGDLCIALGPQRGVMSVPQGYMEARLPKDNLSGVPEDFSRLNRSTGEFVAADKTMTQCAVRELYEELGIKITEEQLTLIDVTAHNPMLPTVEVNYGVLLDNAPSLKTIDEEFKDDDMSKPHWFKVKDIKCLAGNCYPDGVKLPMKQCDIPTIQKTINTLFGISDQDKAECQEFLSFNAKVQMPGLNV